MTAEYRRELELGTREVPSARAAVRVLLEAAGRGRGVVEAAELLTTELVTNAVLHDGLGPVVLRISVGSVVRVAVHDNDPRPPQPRPLSAGESGGRGLVLVSKIATRWGWAPEGGGKVVWFELG